MLRQYFTIPKYDWEVYVYYHVNHYYIDEILKRLRSIGCPHNHLSDAYYNMASNKLNTGFTYSNDKYRSSVMIISDTSSPAQFMNSYDHERQHLINHILEVFDISPTGEEAAYLAGDIGQLMYPKAKYFLCKCHCL